MKLQEKVKTLINSFLKRQAKPAVPERRPTPMDDTSLPLDPADGWGIVLEPVEERNRKINDFIEQLALEAYFNGKGFCFSDQELEARFLSFFQRLVESGQLKQREDMLRVGPSVVGPDRWIQAQQVRINRLQAWWRLYGGPDIEPRVM